MASPAEVLGKRGRPSDSESETNDVSIDWNESVPSDTELVIQSIQKTAPRLHGFVFLHQVYSLLSNRTLVDDDINNLRLNSKSYKVLHCEFKKSGGSAHKFTNAMVLIQTEEYIRSLEKTINDDSAEGRMLIAAFSSWLRNSTQISVLRKDLLVSVYSKVASSVVQIESTLTHKDVDRLINCGFLHYRNVGEIDSSSGSMVAGSTDSNQELFWLSHPAVRWGTQCTFVVQCLC